MKTFLFRAALGSAIIGLAGCNSLTGDGLETIRLAISGPASQLSTEQVNAVDGPVLLVELGVAEAMLVSSGASAGRVEWYGVTEMLLTHGGRVVQSAGLPTDLIAPLAANDPFVRGLHTLTDSAELTRLVDYPALYQTGLRQQARYRVGRLESVTYMGASHQLLRVDEMIHMPELGFRATNKYWVEPDTGLVRHSVQHIAPDLPPLRLTLVKTADQARGAHQP